MDTRGFRSPDLTTVFSPGPEDWSDGIYRVSFYFNPFSTKMVPGLFSGWCWFRAVSTCELVAFPMHIFMSQMSTVRCNCCTFFGPYSLSIFFSFHFIRSSASLRWQEESSWLHSVIGLKNLWCNWISLLRTSKEVMSSAWNQFILFLGIRKQIPNQGPALKPCCWKGNKAVQKKIFSGWYNHRIKIKKILWAESVHHAF